MSLQANCLPIRPNVLGACSATAIPRSSQGRNMVLPRIAAERERRRSSHSQAFILQNSGRHRRQSLHICRAAEGDGASDEEQPPRILGPQAGMSMKRQLRLVRELKKISSSPTPVEKRRTKFKKVRGT